MCIVLKFRYKVLSAIVLVSFWGCQTHEKQPEDRIAIRIALQNRVAKKAQLQHQLQSSGFGFWGPDNYKTLDIHFHYPDLLNEDEARFMIVDIAADFLEEVNKDEKIRPYLCQYPYAIENLSIAIFPNKNIYEIPVHPNYMLIEINKGKITYKTKEEGQKYGYHSEKTETFEEALDKLRQQGRIPDYFKDYPSSKE